MSNALNELIEIISGFTPDQLEQFLSNPTVTTILQSEDKNESPEK